MTEVCNSETEHTPLTGAPDGSTPVAVEAEIFHWRIRSQPELVEKVVMQLKDRAEACGVCSPDRITGLVIALTEAITNAMVHGNLEISSDVRERMDGEYGRLLACRCGDPMYAQREVQVHVHWDGKKCVWTIADAGQGFDVDRVLSRLEVDGPPEELASGRGILLMRAFMDDVRWTAGGREVRLVMTRDGHVPINEEKKSRVRHAVKAKGFDAMDEEPAHAIATGVSDTGMDILGVGLSQAKRLMIEIEVNGTRTLVPAEVRHVTKLAADWVQIDCRFTGPGLGESPADAETQRLAIERLLQSTARVADGGHERREADRYQYTEVVRVERKDGTVFHGVARDLSRGGMAFIGNFELERNEVVTITLEPETAIPVRVPCELMRCQQLAGVYRDFGVRFLTAAKRAQ